MRNVLWASVVLICSAGCSLTMLSLGQANPRPNVDIEESSRSVALELAESIQDDFEVPGQQGIVTLRVQDWRKTLEVGFKNGFSNSFDLDSGKSEMKVQIKSADFVLVPSAVRADGRVVAMSAQVRYQARLLDGEGKVVRRSARTVSSKGITSDGGDLEVTAASAVESMYEAIAADFFSSR